MADDIKVKIGGDASGMERAAQKAQKSGKEAAEEIKRGLSAAGGAAGDLGNKLMEAAGSPLTALTAGILAVGAAITKLFEVFEQRIKRAADLARQEADFRDDDVAREGARIQELLTYYQSQKAKIDQRAAEQEKAAVAMNEKYGITGRSAEMNIEAVRKEAKAKINELDAIMAQILQTEFGKEIKRSKQDGYTYADTDFAEELYALQEDNRKSVRANLQKDVIALGTDFEQAMGDNNWGDLLNNALFAEDMKTWRAGGGTDAGQLIQAIDHILTNAGDFQEMLSGGRYEKLAEIRKKLMEIQRKQQQLDREDLQEQNPLEDITLQSGKHIAGMTAILERDEKRKAEDAKRAEEQAKKNEHWDKKKEEAEKKKEEAERKKEEALDANRKMLEQLWNDMQTQDQYGELIAKQKIAQREIEEQYAEVLANGSKADKKKVQDLIDRKLRSIEEEHTQKSILTGTGAALGTDAITRLGGFLGREVRSRSEILMERQMNYQRQIAENTLKMANKGRTF